VSVLTISNDLSLSLEGREWSRSGKAARIRRAAGVTQAQVARELDVSASAVARWEQGLRTPRTRTAARYAALLRELAGL
jgi:transcriptional regulator with XRE-family HTH domain